MEKRTNHPFNQTSHGKDGNRRQPSHHTPVAVGPRRASHSSWRQVGGASAEMTATPAPQIGVNNVHSYSNSYGAQGRVAHVVPRYVMPGVIGIDKYETLGNMNNNHNVSNAAQIEIQQYLQNLKKSIAGKENQAPTTIRSPKAFHLVRNGLPLYSGEGVNWSYAPLQPLTRVRSNPNPVQQGTGTAPAESNHPNGRHVPNTASPHTSFSVHRAVYNILQGTATHRDDFLYKKLLLPTDLADELMSEYGDMHD